MACYARKRSFVAAVVNRKGKCKTSVMVKIQYAETAEEVAIALAVAITEAEIVIRYKTMLTAGCPGRRCEY